MDRFKRFREWWATAQSTLIVHRRTKWIVVLVWIGAEVFGYIDSIRILAHVSYAAFVYAVWAAEGAAKVEVKQEEAQEPIEGENPS